MRAAGLACALRTWACFATDAQSRTRRLGLALGEWRGGSFRKAWLTWCDAFRRMERLRAALSSLRHRHVRACFNQLIGQSGQRRALRAAAMALRHGVARRALNQWMGVCEALATHRAGLRRALAAMHPALRAARKAFVTMADHADARARALRLLRRGGAALAQLSLIHI